MSKMRMVTRTVIDSKKYQVYQMVGTQLKPLDVIEGKGKISERDLAKKYNVDKVVLVCIEENKITYGMPVDEFMKYAQIVENEEN
jgi:hypothetical protein